MKNKLIIALSAAALLTFTACNQQEAKENSQLENSSSETKGLVLTIEGVFPKNDRFELFYSNDQNFDGNKMIRQAIYGEPVVQTITFNIPEDVKPQYLRFDLGSNEEQHIVSIKNIKIDYNGINVMDGSNEKYLEYFPENSTVDYIPEKLIFELKKNMEGQFDPILFSNDNLKKALNKVYNKSK